MISRTGAIDDLCQGHPDLLSFLIEHGLPCIVCGEPFWGTIEELAVGKGWDDA